MPRKQQKKNSSRVRTQQFCSRFYTFFFFAVFPLAIVDVNGIARALLTIHVIVDVVACLFSSQNNNLFRNYLAGFGVDFFSIENIFYCIED